MTAATSLTSGEQDLGVEKGVADAVSMTSGAVFNASGAAASAGGKTETANASFSVTLGEGGIDHAGVFKYILQETDGSVPHITYDTTRYILYLTVVNDKNVEGGLTIQSAEFKASDDAAAKSEEITNYYGNPGTDDELNQLVLTKYITGNAANLGGSFKFKVTINSTDGNGVTSYHYTTTDNPTGDTITEGVESGEIELGNGDALTIYGLQDGDTYSIVEVEANADGYDTTYVVDNAPEVTHDYTASITDTMSNVVGNDNKVVINVTNNRDTDDIPATGIIMNVAPYVLMVGIAVAGCFVFLRKRRDD